MTLLTGRWRAGILYLLASGCCRYVHLIARLPGVSPKVLTAQLRMLEREGLVTRNVIPHGRRRVEYELTPTGEALRPVLTELERWGRLAERDSGGSRPPEQRVAG